MKMITLALLSSMLASPALAAVQSSTIPFSAFKSQVAMQPGQTYLSFMLSTVNHALNSFQPVIDQEANTYPNQYSRWQYDLAAAGQGVAIKIDPSNYFFNIGYADGSNPSQDIKSGRSYGVGPTNRESDPSDLAYLTELGAYYASEPDKIGYLHQVLLMAIFNCDSSAWKYLSPAGQIVATDFMAIYTAESDRHIMVGLNPGTHPWEIDLAAATFVSSFVAATGKTVSNGQLVNGNITQWWAKGSVGSGIGETRRDRLALQQLIARHMAAAHPDVINSIETVVGRTSNADMIQAVFQYLNAASAPRSLNNPAGAQLMSSFMKYLQLMRVEASSVLSQ